MKEPITISPRPPEVASQNFALLREAGLSVIQELASDTWTDHNIHDPGITLLETMAYALTEGGLRLGMDMADLIASSGVDRPAEYFLAQDVLPMAPVTADDFRKILIDHPLVRSAWVFPKISEPRGRLDTLLEFTNQELNSNNFTLSVVPPALTASYQVDLALPYWDEEDVIAFQEDVQLQAVAFQGAPNNIWNPIEGSRAFFARATITYQPSVGGPQNRTIWVVAQILTPLTDSALEVPPVLAEVTTEIRTLGDNSPADQTLLKRYNRRVTAAHESLRVIRRYAKDYRNLCRNSIEYRAVRQQEVAVSSILEVNAGVNIERLLAEVYFRIDRMLSPPISFTDLADELSAGGTTETGFDGPLLDSGILLNRVLGSRQVVNTVYVSDILRVIFQLRNGEVGDLIEREDTARRDIVAVRNLTLSNFLDNRPISTNAKDCLRLVNSKRHVPVLSVTKSRIVVFRNNIEIPYDTDLVLQLFQGLKGQAAANDTSKPAGLPLPTGEAFDITAYYPLQNDLPVNYGVGEAGLPAGATEERRALARQLKGYLFLAEQLLGGFMAQLGHFNRFFSADPQLEQTIFQQPLYQIDDAAALLKAFNPSITSWDNFIADSDNGYVRTLRDATESKLQFLERRNRVLDHLLATLGEDLQDRAALVFRLTAELPAGAAPTLPQLLDIQEQQRIQALTDLIQDKSAYYYDLPRLSRDRYQSYGHLAWRNDGFYRLIAASDTWSWEVLDDNGIVIFTSTIDYDDESTARRAAEKVLSLATVPNNYRIVPGGGGLRQLEIEESEPTGTIAISFATYNTDPAAQMGIQDTVDNMLRLWTEYALIPYECRLYHLFGITPKRRRELLRPVADFIEIFDEIDADPFIEKRFRLFAESGLAGAILMESEGNYPGPTDPEATAAAEAAVQTFITRGIRTHHYHIDETGPASFEITLLAADGTVLARTPNPAPDRDQARETIARISALLYRHYSAEGLYVIEHPLLFPPDDTGVPLAIPDTTNDVYSQQLTVVLPSGFARDFSLAEAPRQPAQPELYRDEEFRTYAAEQIRKYCPTDILPRILWVDRALPGSPVNPGDPSFDQFENRYWNWLAVYLIDEATETDLQPVREPLRETLTAIYVDLYPA